MNRVLPITLTANLASIGMVGCTETTKSSTIQETKIVTPGGTMTITTEKEVKKSGDKPPVATP